MQGPTDHRSVFTSTRVGTNMPRYALNLLQPLNPPPLTTPRYLERVATKRLAHATRT